MPVVVGLAAVMLAVMALLLMYGVEAFGKAVAHLFPKNIGFSIATIHPRQWVEDVVNAIGDALTWVVGNLITPAVAFVLRPVLSFIGLVMSISSWVNDAADAIRWVITEGIPAALHAAKVYAARLVNAARTYALSLYHKALSYAATLVHAARAYALQLYHKAEHYAYGLVHAARAYAAALVATAVHDLHVAVTAARHYSAALVRAAVADMTRLIARLEARIVKVEAIAVTGTAAAVAAGVKTAEDYADTVVAAVPTILATDIGVGIGSLFDGLIEDVGALEGVIGTDLPDIGAAIRAIPRAIPTDLVGDLAIGLTVARVMTRYLSECGIPNCRNLSKVGRDLQELFGVVEGGAFLGLIGYMVSDPTGAAHEANDVLTPIASGLVGAARDLIGV